VERITQLRARIFLEALLRGALRDSAIYGDTAIRELGLIEISLQMYAQPTVGSTIGAGAFILDFQGSNECAGR
jgi:hypothetical protein